MSQCVNLNVTIWCVWILRMETQPNKHFCCLREIGDIYDKNFTLLLMKSFAMPDGVIEEGKDFFVDTVVLETKTEVSFLVYAMDGVFEQ